MEKTVRSFLESLKLGRRQSHENLTIFPLMAPQNGAPDYLTLEEALAEGCMRITELSEGGSVPELRLFNDSPRAVLIVEGEELSGAKQNRVVNATFLVPGKTQLVIPVSCVEQGRWSYKGRSLHSGGKVMHASLRRAHQRAVGERIWHESQRAERPRRRPNPHLPGGRPGGDQEMGPELGAGGGGSPPRGASPNPQG